MLRVLGALTRRAHPSRNVPVILCHQFDGLGQKPPDPLLPHYNGRRGERRNLVLPQLRVTRR
jgi:hypothetical protein